MFDQLRDLDRFHCDRRDLNQQVSIVTVVGEVDPETAPTLEAMLLATLSADARHVIVDLKDVSLLDSSGLSALVGAWRVACERGGSIRLACASRNARKVLSITALDEVFPMDEDLRAAIALCGVGSSRGRELVLETAQTAPDLSTLQTT